MGEERSLSWLTVQGGEVGELETGGTDKRVVQERGEQQANWRETRRG